MAEEEGLTLIWESVYHEKEDIWEARLTGFVREREKEMYRKFKEVHREKAYRPAEVEAALKPANLKLLASYDAFTFNHIHEKIFYVAKRIS